MRSLRIFTADREPEMKYEFEMSDSSPPYWEDNPLLAPCITNTGGTFFLVASFIYFCLLPQILILPMLIFYPNFLLIT